MTKILIIEGVGPMREAVAHVLRDANFTTITAEDGVEGVKQAQKHVPDLILCDTDIPSLDGYGVFAELRKFTSTANIPFILMTTPAEQAAHPQAAFWGIDRLYKPFSVAHLVSVVETHLSQEERISGSVAKNGQGR